MVVVPAGEVDHVVLEGDLRRGGFHQSFFVSYVSRYSTRRLWFLDRLQTAVVLVSHLAEKLRRILHRHPLQFHLQALECRLRESCLCLAPEINATEPRLRPGFVTKDALYLSEQEIWRQLPGYQDEIKHNYIKGYKEVTLYHHLICVGSFGQKGSSLVV